MKEHSQDLARTLVDQTLRQSVCPAATGASAAATTYQEMHPTSK